VADRQCREVFASAVKEWISADHKRVRAQGCEDRVKVAFRARMQDLDL
jgi:hypothetical protein